MSMFKLPEGIVRPTGTPDKPGKGAVIKPSRFYVYPDGHGYLFFENPIKGKDDISVPFDGFYDAITFLSIAFYEAQKVAEKQPSSATQASQEEPMSEQDLEQHEIEIREPDGSQKLGRFTGRLIEQTEGWNIYITDDDRVIAHDESTRRVEIKSVQKVRDGGGWPRFKKLRDEIGPPEPEDI